MSTGSILSILAYPQCGYHLVYHTGLSLVHCSYLSVGSLQKVTMISRSVEISIAGGEGEMVRGLSLGHFSCFFFLFFFLL